MTRNQIEYNKLLEQRRSNLQQELLTRQRDIKANRVALAEVDERRRHNEFVEWLDYASLGERAAHNQASRAIQQFHEDEIQRSNLMKESYNALSLDEVIRSNLRSEGIQATNVALQHQDRATQISLQDQVARLGLSEQVRHSLATEYEVQRSNKAQEELQNRRITLTDQRKQEEIGLQSARNLIDRERISKDYNLRNRALTLEGQSLDERVRHNYVQESIDALANTLKGRELDIKEERGDYQNFGDAVVGAANVIKIATTLGGM